MPVSMDDFAPTISRLLDDYEENVREAINQAVLDAGKQALKTVREKSPVRKGTKGGKYRKSWKMAVGTVGTIVPSKKATIYNAKYGPLVHLLEDGHQKMNGGRVEGIPHVRPAYEEADRTLETRVAQAIEGAGDDL